MTTAIQTQRTEISFRSSEDERALRRLYDQGEIKVGDILVISNLSKELVIDVRDGKDLILGGIWTGWQEKRIAARTLYQPITNSDYFNVIYFRNQEPTFNNALIQKLKEAELWREQI